MDEARDGKGGDATGAERAALEARVRELREELRRRELQLRVLDSVVGHQRTLLANIQGSLAWRTVTRLRRARDGIAQRAARLAPGGRVPAWLDRLLRTHRPAPPSPPEEQEAAYAAWVERNAPSAAQLEAMRTAAARLIARPTFSVVLDGGGEAAGDVGRCRASLRAQVWSRWELLEPGEDWRRARGDLVLFLGPSDALAPEALFALALALEAAPDAEVLYADEDALGDDGRRRAPFFKPDWSPDLLLSYDYLGRLTAYRRALLDAVGGPRPELGAGWRHDLALRATERAHRIEHVPAVLLHGRQPGRPDVAPASPEESEGARRALEEAVRRRALRARVEPGRHGWRVRRDIEGRPLVSIVMPTRDKVDVLRRCVESVERRSSWAARELLVVDNGSTERRARAYLDDLARRHRVLRDPRPFNWSALNDAAAREARGDFLLFMNNDMEVVTPDWIEALLEHGQRSEVGAVGAKLLYPDRTVQHAGVVLGLGLADHAFKGLPDRDPGYACLPHVARDVSAVTGACLLVRREVFERHGGFDERLPVAFNDVDFCLRLRRAGLLVVYTPFAELLHYESVSRGAGHPPDDEALAFERWREVVAGDPYYSPHLTRDLPGYGIRQPGSRRPRTLGSPHPVDSL